MISVIACVNPAGVGARAVIAGLLAREVCTRPPGGERS